MTARRPRRGGAGVGRLEALLTADSDLGEIVVDGEGMTVYMFDNDTQGGDASTCEGECAGTGPPSRRDAEDPTVDGVTGEIGTITGVDGEVRLAGWPLYSSQATAPRATNG